MYFNSLKTKFLVFFIFILVLQATITGSLYYYSSTQPLKEKLYRSYQMISESTAKSLDSRLERIEWYMMSILTNVSLQTLLKNGGFQNKNDYYYESMVQANRIINNILYNESDIEAAFLIPLETSSAFTFINKSNINLQDTADGGFLEYNQTIALNGKINWIGFVKCNGKRYFTVSRLLRDLSTRLPSSNPLAVVYLCFSESMISDILTNEKIESESCLVILDESMNMLASSGESTGISSLGNIDKNLSKSANGIFEYEIDGKHALVSFYTLKNRPWRVAFIVPYTNMSLEFGYVILTATLVGVLMFIVFASVSYIFTNSIVKPLTSLYKGFTALESGDFDISVKKTSKDEVGKIIDGFNRMTGRLKALFDKTVEEEKQKREYEIRALRYQINPHFLYNALNSVRLMALTNKNTDIAKVVGGLIKYLRSVVAEKKPLILLKEEIDNIQLYVFIQNIRYNGMIKMTLNMDDNAGICFVPGFILQPIVENAIFHGIDPAQSGTLQIKAACSNKLLQIYINDDGVGMTEQKISTLFDSDDDDLTHLGLKNVDRRIKLQFGQDYGITISSEVGAGTSVKITLPEILTFS